MRPMLTVKEVARRLAVSPWTVYQWCYQGVLPSHKIGGSVRITEEALERHIELSRQMPATTP